MNMPIQDSGSACHAESVLFGIKVQILDLIEV